MTSLTTTGRLLVADTVKIERSVSEKSSIYIDTQRLQVVCLN